MNIDSNTYSFSREGDGSIFDLYSGAFPDIQWEMGGAGQNPKVYYMATSTAPISLSTSPNDFDSRMEYMKEIETKINNDIGYRFWKKYITAAFWSYLSMPINLSITMMTAIATAQATTDNLLPRAIYVNISLATLVISTLNTYFRPYVQMNQNVEYMNKWSVLGFRFEEIIYSEKKTLEHINARIAKYDALLKDMNELKKTEILETQNFCTDSIHSVLRLCDCCLKNKNGWLTLDEILKREDEEAKMTMDKNYPHNEEFHLAIPSTTIPSAPSNSRPIRAGIPLPPPRGHRPKQESSEEQV